MQGTVLLEILQNAKLTLCKIKFPTKNKCKAGYTFFQILPIKQILVNILYPTTSNCVIQMCIKCNLLYIYYGDTQKCMLQKNKQWLSNTSMIHQFVEM